MDRRSLLLGSSALALTPWPSQSTAFADPATVAASAGLINATLDFFKKSGDMDRELNAIHIMVNAILASQKQLMQAIQVLNDQTEAILSKLKDIPSETISLGVSIKARELAAKIADIIDSRTTLDTASDAARYESLRFECMELSYSLAATAAETTRRPSLVIACKHLLRALTLFSRYDQKLNVDVRQAAKPLLASALNLASALELMTSLKGLEVDIQRTRNLINKSAAPLENSPFAVHLLPKNPTAVGAASAGGRTVTLCLQTTLPTTRDPGYRSPEPALDGPRLVISGSSTQAKTATRIAFSITTLVAHGGRPSYRIERTTAEKWQQQRWERVTDDRRRVVHQTDNAVLQGCVEFADGPNGSQQEWSKFSANLETLADLTAIEGRLLALRDAAISDLGKTNELIARLQTSKE